MMINPLGNNAGYGDPMRTLSTFSGTLVKWEDIVDYQVLGNVRNPDKSFTGNKTEVLKQMKETSSAVRNLMNNEDFKPSIDPACRATWLNEMSKLRAFEAIINDFANNTPEVYEQLLQEHLVSINENYGEE